MSNLLAMPLVALAIETSNNEDWIDSLKFVVDDGSAPEDMPQLDIRGIVFDMEVRRSVDDVEVTLAASSKDGTLLIGDPPDFGFLIFQIPLAEMQTHRAGSYVGDVIGNDGVFTRKIADITLTITEGVTKQPVNTRIVIAA